MSVYREEIRKEIQILCRTEIKYGIYQIVTTAANTGLYIPRTIEEASLATKRSIFSHALRIEHRFHEEG
jgi:hypothetical protein